MEVIVLMVDIFGKNLDLWEQYVSFVYDACVLKDK